MAAGANDKPTRYRPNPGTAAGKAPNIGFSFAQTGYSKSNVLAAATNHPAPIRSRSMAPLRTSGGRKEPPAPPAQEDDVFMSPVNIGEMGDPAPRRLPPGARDQRGLRDNQHTDNSFQPHTSLDNGDADMSRWPPASTSHHVRTKSQVPVIPPTRLQAMRPEERDLTATHIQDAHPQHSVPSDIAGHSETWHQTSVGGQPRALPPIDEEEDRTPRRLPLHPRLSAKTPFPPSAAPHSGKHTSATGGFPQDVEDDEAQLLHEIGTTTAWPKLGTTRASDTTEEPAPASAYVAKAGALASDHTDHEWGNENQPTYQFPARPPTAFARRVDMDEAEPTDQHIDTVPQDASHFASLPRPESSLQRGLAQPEARANNPILRRPSLHPPMSLAQPQVTTPSFPNKMKPAFSLNHSDPFPAESRYENPVVPASTNEQNFVSPPSASLAHVRSDRGHLLQGNETIDKTRASPWVHLTPPFAGSSTDMNGSMELPPTSFSGQRNSAPHIDVASSTGFGDLSPALRFMQDAQSKYKAAEEANANHVKTIQWLQLEKSRLTELNHKLGEDVQNAKGEVEAIKQAKEDSIANAKRLVKECINKAAAIESAFNECEEVLSSRLETADEAIAQLRRTTAEIKDIKDGVDSHCKRSDRAREVMAATAAEAVNQVKEAAEELSKALRERDNALRAIETKDSTIRDLKRSIDTKEAHNEQLTQNLQAIVEVVGDDAKSFTNHLETLIGSGLLSPDFIASLQANREDDSLQELKQIKAEDDKLILDLRRQLQVAEINRTELESDLNQDHQQELHNLTLAHNNALMSSAQEINTLQTTNAALKKEVSDLQEMLQKKDAEAKANDVKLREAATVARAGGESIQAQLESEVETMRADKKQVEAKIESYQKEIQTLKDTITQANQTEKVAQALANDRSQTIKELKTDVSQKMQQLQQVPKLEKENAILQTQLSKAKEQLTTAETELERVKLEVSEHKEAASRKTGVKELQSKVTELQQRLADKEERIKDLKNLVSTSASLATSHKNELAKVTEDNGLLALAQQAEIEELRQQLQNANKEKPSPTTGVQRLQNAQLTEEDRAFQAAIEMPLRAEARDKDNRIRELENENKKLKANGRQAAGPLATTMSSKKATARSDSPASSLSEPNDNDESTINDTSLGPSNNGKRPISALDDEDESESELDKAFYTSDAVISATSAAELGRKKPASTSTRQNARTDAAPDRRQLARLQDKSSANATSSNPPARQQAQYGGNKKKKV